MGSSEVQSLFTIVVASGFDRNRVNLQSQSKGGFEKIATQWLCITEKGVAYVSHPRQDLLKAGFGYFAVSVAGSTGAAVATGA